MTSPSETLKELKEDLEVAKKIRDQWAESLSNALRDREEIDQRLRHARLGSLSAENLVTDLHAAISTKESTHATP